MQSTSSIQEPWNISPHSPLQVGKFMEMDEERKDSTSIQGNSLATQIDFGKNETTF